MKTREILSILVLMLGIMAAVMPDKKNDSKQLTNKEMLLEMNKKSKYVSVDELTELLISGDPSVQLIDIRPASLFEKPLPRAINIPMDSITSENFEFLFNQDIRKNIIYGIDDVVSLEVWKTMTQKGYRNNYILKGGLMLWNSEIINPEHPGSTASQDAIDLYEKRMAARMYFTGAKTLPKTEFKMVLPQGGIKKRRVQGGCS